jgi:hypothetical protein
MKSIYLTSADTRFIYDNLKNHGHYEWFVILRCVEEMQCDYTFFSTLTWADILYNNEITDAGGGKYATYEVSIKLKDEVSEIVDILDITDLNQLICGKLASVTARELYKKLCEYECIKQYQSSGIKIRIDSFGEYRVDKDGTKIYAEKKLDSNLDVNGEEKVKLYSLYVAEWADKMAHKRPKGFELKSYDKKVGVAGNVDERMKTLSVDKRSGGTLSPMFVKALRAWHLPIKECIKLETRIHDYLDDRKTGGEWFTDYYEDVIEIVLMKIEETIENGINVVELNIDKETEDITFYEKMPRDFWFKTKQEENNDDGPVIYRI